MLFTLLLIVGIIMMFAGALFLHSAAVEREQRELAASFERARDIQWKRTAALIHWPETEPMCFHRGVQ